MKPQRVPRVLRKILLLSLPAAALSASVGVQGCACPREELEAVFEVQVQPKSLEECIELCRKELTLHYQGADTWSVSQIRECSDTQILAKGSPNNPGQLSPAVRCEYTITMACVGGRLPSGLSPQEQFAATNELGAYFAKLCFLEKAAVEAFSHLARELDAHNAPQHMIDRALQAEQEEIEHAEMTALLTQLYDADVPEVELEEQPIRRLEALAYENAIEGCIHETFAPLTALWQSQTSTSPEVRAVMGRIAKEEAEHAALSWEIDQWISPQLSPDQRKVKDLHQRGALASMRQELQKEPSKIMHEIGGLPTSAQAMELYSGMKRELWQL